MKEVNVTQGVGSARMTTHTQFEDLHTFIPAKTD